MTSEKNDKKQGLDKIKSGVFSRGLTMARLTLQTGAKLAGQGMTQALSDPSKRDERWKVFLKGQASVISQELGELKGSLMKAGQMLSMYGEHFLPPEANELLKSLQQDSPALKWTAIEPVLQKYLSAELLAELEIEKEALACASMGQVHRARIKATGETICLKIQYPDVDKAIDSDLKAIRTLLNMLKLLPRDVNFDPVFAEVRTMLIQETNYEIEADFTEEYAKKLEGDSRFVVPKLYRKYCSRKVLATSFERGLRADDPLIQNLSQDRRNALSLNFLDLYLKELFDWGLVQTDPHIGNYKIRIDPSGRDQVVLLDFGASRQYDDTFLNSYHRMIKGSLLRDREAFLKAATELRFIQGDDQKELVELFEEFCAETIEPFMEPSDPRNTKEQIAADGTYDWKNTDLPNRLTKRVFHIVRNFEWRTPPQEILFLDRKTGGVFIFMAVLRARVSGRTTLMKYLDKVPG